MCFVPQDVFSRSQDNAYSSQRKTLQKHREHCPSCADMLLVKPAQRAVLCAQTSAMAVCGGTLCTSMRGLAIILGTLRASACKTGQKQLRQGLHCRECAGTWGHVRAPGCATDMARMSRRPLSPEASSRRFSSPSAHVAAALLGSSEPCRDRTVRTLNVVTCTAMSAVSQR